MCLPVYDMKLNVDSIVIHQFNTYLLSLLSIVYKVYVSVLPNNKITQRHSMKRVVCVILVHFPSKQKQHAKTESLFCKSRKLNYKE